METGSVRRRVATAVGRRRLMRWTAGALGMAAVGPLLSACGGAAPAAPTAASQAPAAAGQAPTAASQAPAAAPTAPQTAAQAKPAGSAPQAAGPVTLRLHPRTGPYNDVWTEVGQELQKRFPNVKVETEPFPSNVLTQKVLTMATGGTIGDAFFASVSYGEHFYNHVNGVTYDLTDLAKRDNLDWSQWFKTTVEALSLDGRLTAMIDGASPNNAGLYYNKALLKAGGVAEPTEEWTLDKYVEAARTLTKGDVWGLHNLHVNFLELITWPRAFGGDIYSKDGTKATLNRPESLKGLEWVWNCFHTWKCSPSHTIDIDTTGQGYTQMFAAGKLAMFGSGIWDVTNVMSTKIDWGLAPAPKGPIGQRGTMATANIAQITKLSKNPDMAWEWAKLDAGRESGILHLTKGVTPGGRPDVYGDPQLTKQYPYLAVYKKAFDEAMPYSYPANFRGQEVSATLSQGLDPVWLNAAKFDTAAIEQVNAKVQEILNKPKA
jgi:multiple sugar transport system substrate-binding protein